MFFLCAHQNVRVGEGHQSREGSCTYVPPFESNPPAIIPFRWIVIKDETMLYVVVNNVLQCRHIHPTVLWVVQLGNGTDISI
jgi:hypothetical protein